MCGIAGVHGWVDERMLEEMLSLLVHRGPDDVGTFIDRDAGVMLGNRRLSIIDLHSGHQPMSGEDGEITVVFNGEIYNHRALRENLKDRGHRFKTDCDTEVLVHLWQEYGREMPRHLEGMFAFSLWDAKDRELFLARDRLGIKPLYWATVNGGVVWASEIQPLILSGADTAIDERAVYNYFYTRYTPWPDTPLEAVRKLPPGSSLTITSEGVVCDRYWQLNPNRKVESFGQLSDRVRVLLEESVERRLMSDVPIGAFLSGGLDSTAIVGLMSEHVDDLRTFSVSFDDPTLDESNEAQFVADHFGTDHTELVVDLSSLDRFEDVICRLGEPVADPAILPTALLAEAASDDVKVVQTGEGADELFGGYYRYRHVPRHRRLAAHIPGPILRGVSRFADIAPGGIKHLRYAGSMASDRDAIVATASRLDLPPNLYLETNLRPETSGLLECVEATFDYASEDFESKLEAFDMNHWLPDDLLYKVDQATMLSSLEARVPYLSTDLVETVYGLPADVKLSAGFKPLLRSAVSDIVPERTLSRDKQGFELPLDDWFRGNHAVVDRYLDGNLLDATPVVNKIDVLDLLKHHRQGRRNLGDTLWKVMSYVAWYDVVVRD